MATPREVLALCREKSVRAVDLWFTDLWGSWQRLTIPVQQLDEEFFEQGWAGSSAYLGIASAGTEGVVHFVPQPDTAFVDPSAAQSTLGLVCSVAHPITGEESNWDPRNVAVRAANFLSNSGIADAVEVGWAVDYHLFRSPRGISPRLQVNQRDELGLLGIDLVGYEGDAGWDGGETAGLPAQGEVLNIRGQLAQLLSGCGFPVTVQHGLAGGSGQCHLELKSQPFVRAADGLMVCKHLTRQLAREQGWLATFMPLPAYGLRGSRMGMQFGFWQDQRPVFAGSGFAGLSDVAMHAIGGLLRHTPSLMAWTNPSTNSYRRLASDHLLPGYSQRPDSLVHVPNYHANPAAKRVEFLLPDATSNPYLALAAVLMAMIDGVQNKIAPGIAVEQLEADPIQGSEHRKLRLPRDLYAALDALGADQDYLTRGDVFTPDLIHAWIDHKREQDVGPLCSRPHPHEFTLYFDC